jgi:uncharacterized integral membrane protein
MAIVWVLIFAALIILASIFGAQNTQGVNLSFFNYVLDGVPLWLVGVIPLVVGLIIGFLMGVPTRIRHAFTHRRLSGQIEERDRTVGKLQQRVADLERDLEVARRTTPQPIVEEVHEVPPPLEPPPAHLNAA